MQNIPNRRLQAIVSTDIVGFTKLTEINQSKASNHLKEQKKLDKKEKTLLKDNFQVK